MTCIIGLIHDNKVYVGGDSAGTSGTNLTIRKDPKVFKNGPFLIGFAGSFRVGQLLRYALKPPIHPDGMDDYEYMVVEFIKSVRTTLKENGFDSGPTFLVGYKSQLYNVDSDFQIGIPLYGIAAAGCGAQIALGAVHALDNWGPTDKIKRALEIVAGLNTGVAAPFTILSLD